MLEINRPKISSSTLRSLRHCSICPLYTSDTQECRYDVAFYISFMAKPAIREKVCPMEDEVFKNKEIIIAPSSITPLKERLAYQSD